MELKEDIIYWQKSIAYLFVFELEQLSHKFFVSRERLAIREIDPDGCLVEFIAPGGVAYYGQ